MRIEPCPHCQHGYDVSHRTSGDRCLCARCGKWFLVIWYPAGVSLSKCADPTKASAQ